MAVDRHVIGRIGEDELPLVAVKQKLIGVIVKGVTANNPMLAPENRTTLLASIARGRRWLEELVVDSTATAETIAKREACTARKVNMTISLAFLAPDLVKAAIDGTLPHGMGDPISSASGILLQNIERTPENAS